MSQTVYNVIGVMSGTSLDGIDLCHVHIVHDKKFSFQIINTACYNYDHSWRSKLKNAIHLNNAQILELDRDYTIYLAHIIKAFITENNIKNLLAVCSHGHTIFHKPEDGHTLQIGNNQALADLIDQRVVCDFRVQDMTLGGQGAPLVPIGDKFLFTKYDQCLNIGGFANISYDINKETIAYDICPVNIVCNKIAHTLGQDYDTGGAFAASGKIIKTVLKELNTLPYYFLPAPKSLGIEWVKENIDPILLKIESPLDRLATFTEHAAIQIAAHLHEDNEVLITGGGAYNTFLIQRISALTTARITIPDKEIIEFKEALIFALLGVLKLRNQTNCLASVTGASRDHSSGKIFVPKKN